jgi:transcriptional regulator with XRE-family HTH domain
LSRTEPDGHDLRVLGRAIREAREQRGISIGALAVASGIASRDLAAIEAGRLDPGYRRLRRLAAGLGVRPLALMLRVEELDAGEAE